MTDKQVKDKFRYADGTNEQDNYENFINSFDVDDEVYYRGKHYIKFINEQLKAKEQECKELKHEVELMMDCESCKIDEYKQTLTEIKEIAEQISLPMGTGKNCNRVILAKQILQKISEYEVGNEKRKTY